MRGPKPGRIGAPPSTGAVIAKLMAQWFG